MRVEGLRATFENFIDRFDQKCRTWSAVCLIKLGTPIDEWWTSYLAQISSLKSSPTQEAGFTDKLKEFQIMSLELPLAIWFGAKGYPKVLTAWEEFRQKRQQDSTSEIITRDNPFA